MVVLPSPCSFFFSRDCGTSPEAGQVAFGDIVATHRKAWPVEPLRRLRFLCRILLQTLSPCFLPRRSPPDVLPTSSTALANPEFFAY